MLSHRNFASRSSTKKSLLHSAATPPPYHTALESCTPSQLINPYRNFRWFVRTVHLFFQKIFFRKNYFLITRTAPVIEYTIKIYINIFLLIDFIYSFTTDRSESLNIQSLIILIFLALKNCRTYFYTVL